MPNLRHWYKVRFAILQRDNFTCQYCGQSAPTVILHIDHKVPKAKGGMDDPENLITACSACNMGKGLSMSTLDSSGRTIHKGRQPRHHKEKVNKPSMLDAIITILTEYKNASATEIAHLSGYNRNNISHMLAHHSLFEKIPPKPGRSVYYSLKAL